MLKLSSAPPTPPVLLGSFILLSPIPVTPFACPEIVEEATLKPPTPPPTLVGPNPIFYPFKTRAISKQPTIKTSAASQSSLEERQVYLPLNGLPRALLFFMLIYITGCKF